MSTAGNEPSSHCCAARYDAARVSRSVPPSFARATGRASASTPHDWLTVDE